MEQEIAYLAFAICPKVDNHADEVVDGGICALVEEGCTQRREREEGEAEFERAVERRASDESQGPFEAYHEEAEQ